MAISRIGTKANFQFECVDYYLATKDTIYFYA